MRKTETRGLTRALGRVLLPMLLLAMAMPLARGAPSRGELQTAKDRLMELERDFELVVEEYNLAREHLDEIRAEIAQTETVVHNLEQRMSARENDAVLLAEEMYKNGGDSGVEVVLSSESLSELDARLAYIQSSEEANAELFERLAADRNTLEQELLELEHARSEALETEQRLAGLSAEIETKVADQKDEIQDLNAAISRAERRAEAQAAAADEQAAQAAIAAADRVAPIPAPAPNSRAQIAVKAALSQMGKPYQWGAEGPDSYDCSGLTLWAWAHAGVSLPHNSGMQYSATARVSQSDWQPGDLLFFGSPIHHVAMYIGNGKMVEAPYTGSQVRVVSAYRSDYVGAGRP